MRPITIEGKIRKLRHTWQADVSVVASFEPPDDHDSYLVQIHRLTADPVTTTAWSLRDCLDQALEIEPCCGHRSEISGSPESHECILPPHRWSPTVLHTGRNKNGQLVKWFDPDLECAS